MTEKNSPRKYHTNIHTQEARIRSCLFFIYQAAEAIVEMIANPFVSLSAVLYNFWGRTVTSLERNLAHCSFISNLALTSQVSMSGKSI